ncbi:hypothetical protein NXX49_20940 [Candidatus Bacteroides intestinigallinarum]|uniref:hypothetical protein n=1 Tax=Candidatus Bacteroides intestinigallinarum TaxID=2838470 RepID=UPI002165F671|nr:hypothetical protein [Candidatus Bacteroides intestinigallinarum]MCS3202103.1 hypothetical protein [Candidatus Bacteroides intestinigallinarum]
MERKKLLNISDNYPQFVNGTIPMTSDIPIVKSTEVSLVFVNSSAAWYNTVGYYTYETGTTPDIKTIKKTIVFPNVSPVYKTLGKGALVCGEEVKLKYWNEETKDTKVHSLKVLQSDGVYREWDSRVSLLVILKKLVIL